MLISIAVATGLTLVLFVTGLFVVFTPLPVAFTYLRKGVFPAVVASAAALGLLVLFYRLPAQPLSLLPMMMFYPVVSLASVMGLSAVYFFYYLWMGLILAFASRRTGKFSSLEPSVAWMTATGLAVPALALLVYAGFTGMDLGGDLSRGLHSLFGRLIDLQKTTGLEEEQLEILKASAPLVVSKFLQLLPGLWINLTLVVVSLNVLFLRRWTPATRLFPNWPDFWLWRLNESWIWAPIAGGAVYFLNLYLIRSPILDIAAMNALIVLAGVYFFQGLGVGSFFFRTKLPPMLRILGYAAFFLFFQVGAVAVMVLGLSDFWFDFRKLKKIA